ncbi:hypothetical protein MXB_1607 [Myxobolus squamalis]|nr:hypothetical protein MXB_1607 [Myxobolus squamalis]
MIQGMPPPEQLMIHENYRNRLNSTRTHNERFYFDIWLIGKHTCKEANSRYRGIIKRKDLHCRLDSDFVNRSWAEI